MIEKLQERLDLVLDHLVEGKSAATVARERGTSAHTVRKWILRYRKASP